MAQAARGGRTAGRIALALVLALLGRPAAGRAAEPATLTILHINDLHGSALPFRRAEGRPEEGGLARLAALVARERTPSTLFLAAGDLTMGTNLSNLFQGRPVIEALNLMGLDASAVGNHEFDNGLGAFRETAALAAFPFLAANIRGPGVEFLVPWKVLRAGSLRVGLFGLTTPDTPVATHPRNVVGLTFVPPAEAAREAVAALRPLADLVVCVSHLGSDEDEKLAAEVPGIDAIVGGHTHTKMDSPVLVGNTVVVQSFETGSFLGRLDLTVQEGKVTGVKGRLIPVAGGAGEDGNVAALVERYRLQLEQRMGEVVGAAGADLDGSKETLRTRETNLGDLVADILREAASADAALINGGGIRASIARGTVTVGSIYNILPFDNYLVAFKIPGREIRAALEVGVGRVEVQDGGFPQVSGISFAFDPKAPAGARVREVSVAGRPLEDDRIYTLATNDFLAAGGNGYSMFAEREPVFNDASRWTRDIVVDWWRGRGTVTVAADGRIKEAP